jgi:thymidylate synthase
MINQIYKKLIFQCLHSNNIYYHPTRKTNLFQLFNINIIYPCKYYPLLTTRAFYPKTSIAEMLWILSGENNINFISKHSKIWGSFYNGQDTYGGRLMTPINQIQSIINNLKNNIYSKQQYFTYWDPKDLIDKKSLNIPCILGGQFIFETNGLSLKINMRSSDLIYGLPYDIFSHYILLIIIANTLKLPANKLYFNISNLHIYSEYIEENLFLQLNNKDINIPPTFKIKYDLMFNNYINDYLNTILSDIPKSLGSSIKLNSKVSQNRKIYI